MDELQAKLKSILDSHLTPLLQDSWKSTISIYEAGAKPDKDGKLDTVIVWLRSSDIVTHIKALKELVVVDTKEREGISSGHPRVKEDCVIARFMKQIETEDDGPLDFLVEIFQPFGTQDEAEEALEALGTGS